MRRAILVCMASVLTGCALMNQAAPDQRFEAYRSEVKAEREAGAITAASEQEKLRDRYWEIYGKDADSAGHFGYAISLMRSADAGNFPMKEAQALVAARESELFALKMVSRQKANSYEYGN